MNKKWGYFQILIGALVASTLAVSVGCGPEPQIQIRRVPKQHVLDARHGIDASDPDAKPESIFAAIVPHGEMLWFFKVKDESQWVNPLESDFRAIIESVHFEADSNIPQWESPAGWQQDGTMTARGATLVHGSGEQEVKLIISALRRMQGDFQQYLLLNVNRWRGQIGLSDIRLNELPTALESVPLQDESEALLVILINESAPDSPSSAAPIMPDISYDLPEGWVEKELRPGGLRLASMKVEQGEKSIDVSVVALPARGGALLPNVNLWRGALNLDPISADELASSLQQLMVGDIPASYFELTGEDYEGNPKSILVSLFVDQDLAWTLKILGDPDLVQQEKANYESFVQSFRVTEAAAEEE